MRDGFDAEEAYCPKLGHQVTFNYCRQVKEDLPCPKVFDCWQERFPVRDFVRENYTREEIRSFMAPPKPKVSTILDLIKKAQERGDQSS